MFLFVLSLPVADLLLFGDSFLAFFLSAVPCPSAFLFVAKRLTLSRSSCGYGMYECSCEVSGHIVESPVFKRRK